jgi:hypothetical protein
MKTVGFLALALTALGATGCYGWASARYGYQPAYYSTGYARTNVVVQQPAPQVVYQQPTVVYQQPAPQPVVVQPAYQPVYQEPVVLTTPPQTYYYQPTGYYRRPAIYGGVRVYIAP